MDALFDRFAKIPILQKVLGFVGLCLFVCLAFYFTTYSPLLKVRETKNTELQTLYQDLNEKKKLVADLAQYKRDVERLNQELQKALKLLPNRTEIPSLLQKISSLAGKSGLDIFRFQPAPEIPQDFYAKVPVSLELEGTFGDVTNFFDAVGKLSRIVNVGKLSFAVKPLASGPKEAVRKKVLKVSCVATTFRFISMVGDDAQDKAAKDSKEPKDAAKDAKEPKDAAKDAKEPKEGAAQPAAAPGAAPAAAPAAGEKANEAAKK